MSQEMNEEDFIPGTVNIYAQIAQVSDDDNEVRNLKTKKNIILIPQPTDSPNDPLNWSRLQKLINFSILAFITGFTSATANDAGATQDALNEEYGITYDSMNTGAGVLFIGIALGSFFITPFASLYGRKFSYLLCILLGLLGSIWLGMSKNTSDTIWNQLFVGISESCAEAQVQLSLSDLYFQHQLGSVLTVYMLATSVGTYLGPLIAGFIVEYCGFRWVGWIAVIISGGLLIVIQFVMDETMFQRNLYRGIINSARPRTSNEDVLPKRTFKAFFFNEKLNEKQTDKEDDDEIADDLLEQDETEFSNQMNIFDNGANEVPHPYWKRFSIITPASNLKGWGFKQYFIQLKMLLRVFLFPPVIYSGLVWGLQDALLTFYLTVEDDQYYDPPYNYGDTGVALMNIPCLIGAVIGCFYAGVVSDWFSLWLARRNDGIQEPESRLYFLFIPGVLSPIGLIIFAIGTDQQWHWFPTYFGLALVGLGFGASGDVSMSYLMDAYPEMVIEMMCGVAVINNFIGCIFTFACSPWLDAMGNTHTFIILGVIEFVLMMGAAPMIYYGKRIRIWTKDWYVSYCAVRDNE